MSAAVLPVPDRLSSPARAIARGAPDATVRHAASLSAPVDVAEPPKLDGRRTHIVDRALDYVALADQGLTASRIARKRRRSQGYISIALRLGRAIQGMEPGEIAALRSPRVTWKLAQRIVRQDADIVSIRHQLRSAVGGFSTHNVDGRKHRKSRKVRAEAAAASGTASSSGTAQRAVGVAWGWDAAWFARDPAEYVDAHLRYLLGVQHTVQRRAQRAVSAHGLERLSVGQSIRSLQRSLAAPRTDTESGSPAELRALAALEILERKLQEASNELAALVGPPAPRSARPTTGRVLARALRPSPSTVPDDLGSAIEDDLRD